MAHEDRKKALLKKHGLSGVNKPKRTPNHKTKSHVVLAQKGHKIKLIRFGQQGVKGAGKNPKTAKDKARKRSYYARHSAQDPNPDKFSARYWAHKTKWQEIQLSKTKIIPVNKLLKFLGKAGDLTDAQIAARRKKPTQEGIKFGKNKDIDLGMPNKFEEQISRELETAVKLKGSKVENMTVGKKSMANFLTDQVKYSNYNPKLMNKLEKEFPDIYNKIIKKQEKEYASSRRRAGQTKSATAKKLEPGTYMNRETGEIFENVKSMDDLPKGAKKTDYVRNPTPRQLEQFARSARIKAMLKRQGDTPAKDRALDKKKLGRALSEMMSDENIL